MLPHLFCVGATAPGPTLPHSPARPGTRSGRRLFPARSVPVAAFVSGGGGGTSEAVVPVSGAFGNPPLPCFSARSFMPLSSCSWKWLRMSCRSSTETATCWPAPQSPFLLAWTLALTLWSASGVSVSRVMTSPAVRSHSWPLDTTVISLATTKVRRAGSSAGGTSPSAGSKLRLPSRACPSYEPPCPPEDCCCSAASCALHFLRDRLLHFRSQRHRAVAGCLACSVPVAPIVARCFGIGFSPGSRKRLAGSPQSRNP